jgi:hypothetical protein
MHVQEMRWLIGVAFMALFVTGQSLAQETGALTVQVGATSSLVPKGDGLRPNINADLSFVVGPFSLGPELGVYFTGADSLSPNSRPESVFTLGGVTRYRFGAGTWSTHAVLGLGVYWWDSNHPLAPTGTYVSGSLGTGVSRGVGRRGSRVQAEVRLHQVLARTGGPGTRRFLSIGAGFSLGW